MTDPDRNQLFLGFRERGDLTRLAELFDVLAPDLLATARRLTGDPAVAEDLVQATFLIAMGRADRFDSERPVDGWFAGILSRQARDWNRRDARRPGRSARRPGRGASRPGRGANRPGRGSGEESERSSPDADGPARESDAADWLRRTVRRQPRTYREVLLPHLLDGLDVPAVADRLGRSVATVRVRLHRGLRRLRAALPEGFVSGTAFAASTPRGLDAVRRELIEHARGPLTSGVGAPLLGPLPATVPTALAFVAVLAVGGWALFAGGTTMRGIEPVAIDDLVSTVANLGGALEPRVAREGQTCRFRVRVSLRPEYAARTGRHPDELTATVASLALTPETDGTLEFTAFVRENTLDLVVTDGDGDESTYRLEARPGPAREVDLVYPAGI